MSTGAGAGGSSAAYHLSKFAETAGVNVNITVFEQNGFVGGRSTTVYAYHDISKPVELGASIFVEANTILNHAVKEFNLSTSGLGAESNIPGPALAVWNGQEIIYTQNGAGNLWDLAKLFWKYGLVPYRVVKLMKKVVGKFMEMYEEPLFPFASLTQAAQDTGLLAVTAATGSQYIAENGISGDFLTDIVQASTRVNYASNLNYIHGLEAMVCMAAENAMAVEGGNWQMFDQMIKAAKASFVPYTKVTTIKFDDDSSEFNLESEELVDSFLPAFRSHGYDEVIIATPYQFSDLTLPHEDITIDEIPYVQLHVTLFTSPHLLSPSYFNLDPSKAAPKVILTTLPENEEPRKGPEGVGSPGFFSISLLHGVTHPYTQKHEYLYKIFSAEPPTNKFLAQLLDLKFEGKLEDAKISEKDITWMHRKLWNSYPYEWPRVTFEKIELMEGLWYTSGMDSFISTMETNALMGKNVARLIVDKWTASERPGWGDGFAEMHEL